MTRVVTGEPLFAGRVGALATRHGKQTEIGPSLAPTGLQVVVAPVDTDSFGTFTGEVPRPGTPRHVVERKARAGAAAGGLDIGLASEGSFGPHPAFPFVTADVELVAFVDVAADLVVVEQAVSIDTVAASQAFAPAEDPTDFCARVGFPEQALIVRPADGSPVRICKGITDMAQLADAVVGAAAASSDGRALVETDLRAHCCPSRRPVIRAAAERLAARLVRCCPACDRPGFGAMRHEPGRRCAHCGLPTEEPAVRIERCECCGYELRTAVDGFVDPARCGRCNP